MEEGIESESENGATDLRGATRLVVDAIVGVTDLIEEMQRTFWTLGGLIGSEEAERLPFPLGVAHANVRRVTRLVGGGLDAALAQLASVLGRQESSAARAAVVSVVNGVLGDYLAATDNPLAITMRLRRGGEAIDPKDPEFRRAIREADGRLLLLVHGSCTNDRQWHREGHNHGEALARHAGYVPVYLHYNSGRHISENGGQLADLLEAFIEQVPEVRDLAILGHSMGGLVARSAIDQADVAGQRWPELLEAVVCVGSPHHGAPLERAGNLVDHLLGSTPYTAPFRRLGMVRSAGITDLRYGNLREGDWRGRDRFERTEDLRQPVPLREGVDWYAIAGETGESAGPVAKALPGDGMVPVESALGQHEDPRLALGFPEEHQFVAEGTSHLGLLNDPAVYEQIEEWLMASRT